MYCHLDAAVWHPYQPLLPLKKDTIPTQQAETSRTQPEEDNVALRTASLDEAIHRLQAEIAAHQETEKALSHSEARYRNLVESLPDAVFVIQDNRIIYANPAAIQLAVAHDENALLGKSVLDLIHPDTRQLFEQRQQAAFARGEPNPLIAYSLMRSDGSAIEVESVSFAFEYDGRQAFLVVMRDLTERRQVERAAERFRFALDFSPDAIFLIDPATMRFIDANATACITLGYTREELLEHGPHDIKPEFNKATLIERLGQVLSGTPGAGTFQTLHQRKDGSTFPVEVSLRPFESEGTALLVVVARDISARLLAQTQLKEANERFQQFADNVNEVFWIRDLESERFLYVSPAFETLFHKPVSSIYRHPRSFLSVVHPEDLERVASAFEWQRQNRQGVELEYRIIVGGNEIRWLRIRTFPIQDTHGKVFRMAGVAEDVTHRRKSEEQYRNVVQTSMDGFLVANAQGQILDTNEAFCSMLGYNREEMLRLSIPELDQGKSPEQVAEHIQRVMERGHDRFETRDLHKNGQLVDIEVSAHFEPDDNGGIFFCFVRDITQRKQAEEALRESELRYRSVITNLPGITYRCALDADWTVDILSGEVEKLTGYPARDFLDRHRSYASIIHPEDRAKVDRIVREAVMKRDSFEIEYRLCHRRGSFVSVHEKGHGIYDEKGDLLWLDGFIWDETQRKQAEMELHRREAQSRSILRAAPIGIGMLVNRVFLEVNDTMTSMTGYSAEELIGQSTRMLYLTQADFEHIGTEKYRQILESNIGAVETRWRRKDGQIIDVALSSSPIVAGDLSLGVTFTAQDISATKQAEHKRQAHEAKLRDALVREVHHRIKNNLQGVIGLLRNHLSESPDTRQPIEAAINQVNTIAMVHGLQSRIPDKELRLCELVHEASRAAAELAMAPTLPILEDAMTADVWLDSGAVVTVALILNELIQNAHKHARRDNKSSIEISLVGNTQQVIVRIRNSGGPLPGNLNPSTGQGCGTGLNLVRTLLPRRGAVLNLFEADGQITAEFILGPPVTSTHGHVARTPGQPSA